MSRIHFLDNNGLACEPTTKLEATVGTRVTSVPAQTTCGACHLHLRKRYRELAEGQDKEQRAVAKAWWQHGG